MVGRYLYVHIPRRRDGLELTREEVAGERRTLLTRIAAATGRDPTEIERSLTLAPSRAPAGGLRRTLANLVADIVYGFLDPRVRA